jgi:hypothetical protein
MNAEETGIYNYLTGYSALTTALGGTYIYNQIAPQGQAFPYVIFSLAGGGDENLTPHRKRNIVIMAKAVSDTPLEASTLDGHLDDRLHEGSPTVSGWSLIRPVWREDEISFTEAPRPGELVYHKGAYYRMRHSKD